MKIKWSYAEKMGFLDKLVSLYRDGVNKTVSHIGMMELAMQVIVEPRRRPVEDAIKTMLHGKYIYTVENIQSILNAGMPSAVPAAASTPSVEEQPKAAEPVVRHAPEHPDDLSGFKDPKRWLDGDTLQQIFICWLGDNLRPDLYDWFKQEGRQAGIDLLIKNFGEKLDAQRQALVDEFKVNLKIETVAASQLIAEAVEKACKHLTAFCDGLELARDRDEKPRSEIVEKWIGEARAIVGAGAPVGGKKRIGVFNVNPGARARLEHQFRDCGFKIVFMETGELSPSAKLPEGQFSKIFIHGHLGAVEQKLRDRFGRSTVVAVEGGVHSLTKAISDEVIVKQLIKV